MRVSIDGARRHPSCPLSRCILQDVPFLRLACPALRAKLYPVSLPVRLLAAAVVGATMFFVAFVEPTHARAQWLGPEAAVLPPASDRVAPDGAWGITLDPAALAYLESWEIAVLHQEQAPFGARRGSALMAATALPFRLALGGGVEWRHGQGPRGGRASLALAWADSDRLAIGGALRWLGAEQIDLDDPSASRFEQRVSLDLAGTWRPRGYFGASLMVEDLLGPAALNRDEQRSPLRIILAGQLRPIWDDALIVELAAAVDTAGHLGARGSLGVRVPWVGRLGFVAEGSDLASGGGRWNLMGTLAVDFGQVRVEGGAVIDAEGDSDPYWTVGARLRGAERTGGLYAPHHIDDLQIRGSLSARRTLALVHRLDQDRTDRRVRGVFLRFRATDMALAYAQEVRQAIAALEAADKPVLCHLDAGAGSELYACGPATKTVVDQAGGVRLLGPTVHVMYFGEALANLGVRTDFVRIGAFKSAVEQYASARLSERARWQRDVFLDDVQARFVMDLARDRGVDEDRARAWIDQGPYAAGEAVDAGLVHGTADELAISPLLEEVFGTHTLRAPRAAATAPMGLGPRVAVVIVDGEIVDGDNVDIPLLEVHRTGSRTLNQTVEALAADPSVKAIVVRIDSPGGSALASDQIWRALRRAAQHKPVVASLGAVAASGGYYVASACSEIFADPTTVTGSIGIFFGKGDFSPLAERLGIHIEPLSRGRRAGADSLWRPFTGDERAELADKIRIWYRLFIQRVAKGRSLDVSRVHQLGQGRIYSGDAALAVGLVDHLGGFQAALARARQLGGLRDDSNVVFAPGRPSTADRLLTRLRIEHLRSGVSSSRGARVVAGPPLATRGGHVVRARRRSSPWR